MLFNETIFIFEDFLKKRKLFKMRMYMLVGATGPNSIYMLMVLLQEETIIRFFPEKIIINIRMVVYMIMLAVKKM
jgi:hypothetical protein